MHSTPEKSISQTALNNANWNYHLQLKPTLGKKKQKWHKTKMHSLQSSVLSICQDQNKSQVYRARKHFGPNHFYHNIFNRKILKVSYCCVHNIKSSIYKKRHKKVVEYEYCPDTHVQLQSENQLPNLG